MQHEIQENTPQTERRIAARFAEIRALPRSTPVLRRTDQGGRRDGRPDRHRHRRRVAQDRDRARQYGDVRCGPVHQRGEPERARRYAAAGRRRSALLFPALRRFSAERAGIHHSGAVRVLRAEGHQPLQAQESGRGRGGCRSGGVLQRRNAPG
mgnify:CR=1 FL=1